MINFNGYYGKACLFITITAALHFLSIVFGGFAPEATQLIMGGALWLVFGILLSKEWWWAAYFAFIYSLVGMNVALSSTFNMSSVPDWLYWLIVMTDLCIVIILFSILWKNSPNTATS